MGFIIDEYEKDLKQHLNLSDAAWLVIEQDIKNFIISKKEDNVSGFFNTVLTNFYEMADASINFRYIAKEDELEQLFNSSEFKKLDSKIKDTIISKMCEVYKNDLLKKAFLHEKGKQLKIRINVKNVELLREEIHEDEYYEGSIGLYLKALFEEYSQKQAYEREQIVFKDVVDQINISINGKNQLKITTKPNHNPKDNKAHIRRFYVSPYKIVQDSTRSYNYLIGESQEILDGENLGEKTISSFRISRIDKIMVMRSKSGFLSSEKKVNIEKEMQNKLPQFMAGDIIDIKIRFTKKGIENFQKQLYMRPAFYKKVEDEDMTYIFHCTEVQAINYFIKFLRDIEVLEPEYLRNKFIDRYKSALEVYIKENE